MRMLHSGIEVLWIVQVQHWHMLVSQNDGHFFLPQPPADDVDERKMTVMAYVSNNRTTSIGFADRVSAFFATVSEARAKQKIYRQTFSELNALSNRELADLGINRSAIKNIALEAAKLA